MTRLVYGDLSLDFTPTANTHPNSTQIAADITMCYKQAATHYGVGYTATVPDDDFLFAIIKAKVETYENFIFNTSSPGYSGDRTRKPLILTKAECVESDASNDVWTVDSASKSEDIG